MDEIQTTKNFQAKVPISLWREWEQWLEGRGSLNNTQILCGLLRLFLASPEHVQLKAIFGRSKDLPQAIASKPAVADAIVDDAVQHVQARRSVRDRGQGKAS
ncbi:MAG: hypothetical protein MUC88_27080 [Planctomycetes bacterium]|jgi:hypothetical protein|nr:hypothetical protein [Planctomycetota bacterium]